MKLKGQVVLVTGASRGIGRGIALRCASEGASVAVNFTTGPEPVSGKDNRADALNVVQEITKSGGKAIAVEADVSNSKQVTLMVEDVSKNLGPIDTLVNNAGIETIVPLLEMTETQWHEVTNVNLKGEWLCAQAVARQMIKRGSPGTIINFGSIQAGMALPGRSHYAPSKRGVEALTRNLAAELAEHNIRVNCINPGLVATDMTAWVMEDKEVLPIVLGQIPLHRAGNPEDIAKVVVFFASDDSSYVTGQCLYVDGGWIVT